MMKYAYSLADLSIVVSLAASLLGAVRYRQLEPGRRYLAWLVWFSATIEVTAFSLQQLRTVNNLFLLPVVVLGALGLLALAYSTVLHSPGFRRGWPWVLAALAAYALAESVRAWGTAYMFGGLQVAGDLLTLVLVGLYFRRLLNDLPAEKLGRDPFFWLSAGLLVYSLGDLLLALSGDYVMAHYTVPVQVMVVIVLRNVFNLLLYLTYCLVLWMRPLT